MASEYRGIPLMKRGLMAALVFSIGILAVNLPSARAQEKVETPFAITHGPCLVAPDTDEMTVTWHTNRVGVSKVVYGLGALDQTAVAAHAGLIPNDSTCHAVRLTGLKPGTNYQYKMTTREFGGYVTPYVVTRGDTVESDTLTFTTFDPNKASFSFLMWNDIHNDSKRLEAMFNDVTWEGVDFTVLNGDILDDFIGPDQPFGSFYDACTRRFRGKLPMVYVRGNHETRGPMARRFGEYFPGQDERFYWSFDHGPAHFVVLDSGEDKADDHREYAGLVDFARYREQQVAWLRSDLASEAARHAKFRIVLSHQPCGSASSNGFGGQEMQRLWEPIINEAHVQLWLSGHTHGYSNRAPHEGGHNVYRAITNPADATTRVDVAADALQITVIQQGGKVLASVRIAAT